MARKAFTPKAIAGAKIAPLYKAGSLDDGT